MQTVSTISAVAMGITRSRSCSDELSLTAIGAGEAVPPSPPTTTSSVVRTGSGIEEVDVSCVMSPVTADTVGHSWISGSTGVAASV